MDIQQIQRRQFLKLTGISASALVLGATVSPSVVFAEDTAVRLNLFISIEADGTANIINHRSEMGQGAKTGVIQVIADELGADWDRINIIQGEGNKAYGDQNTDGSTTIRMHYDKLRMLGATARHLLTEAAAQTLGVSASEFSVADSTLTHEPTGKTLDFSDVAARASTLTLPTEEQVSFKSPTLYKFIGKPQKIVDMADIQRGTTTFGQDFYIEGTVYASIERPPVLGASVKHYDAPAAKAVAGVQTLYEMPDAPVPALFNAWGGVAVLADNTWSALQGRKALNIEWGDSAFEEHDSEAFIETLKTRVETKGDVLRHHGDAYQAQADAETTVAAVYSTPYLAHAPMEPPAATAITLADSVEIWTCTQNPQAVQTHVAKALGFKDHQVLCHVTLLGGGFGRKSKPDFAVEAALLSRHLGGKPVKVVWSREDDIRHCYYHACAAMKYSASFDNEGSLTSWIQRSAFPSIGWTFSGKADRANGMEMGLGATDVPFDVAAISIETQKAEANFRIGWMRSVCNIQHGFALGVFVDELAEKFNVKPHKMWLKLIGGDRHVDPNQGGYEYKNYNASLKDHPIDTQRLKATLLSLMRRSGANKRTRKHEGWGISVHRSFTAYVAVATKVRVEDGKLTVLDMHSVIDAGLVINPDRARAQLEGAMVFGLSIALLGEITAKAGAIQQSNFHDYKLVRMNQSPKMTAYVLDSDNLPCGIGEPGVPPVAASVVNAIYHASGLRIRDLPISKQLSV